MDRTPTPARLALRPFRPSEDAALLRSWVTGPTALMTWAGPHLTWPLDDAQLAAYAAEPGRRTWTAVTPDGCAVGHVSLADGRLGRVLIAPAARGRGLGEASSPSSSPTPSTNWASPRSASASGPTTRPPDASTPGSASAPSRSSKPSSTSTASPGASTGCASPPPGWDNEPVPLHLPLLQADCANCFALCCVALPFAKSTDFAVNKPAGTPCKNLREDFRCGIHTRLRDQGFQAAPSSTASAPASRSPRSPSKAATGAPTPRPAARCSTSSR